MVLRKDDVGEKEVKAKTCKKRLRSIFDMDCWDVSKSVTPKLCQ